jgi:hypothetical protein
MPYGKDSSGGALNHRIRHTLRFDLTGVAGFADIERHASHRRSFCRN